MKACDIILVVLTIPVLFYCMNVYMAEASIAKWFVNNNMVWNVGIAELAFVTLIFIVANRVILKTSFRYTSKTGWAIFITLWAYITLITASAYTYQVLYNYNKANWLSANEISEGTELQAIDFFYFAEIVGSTVGFGDITPKSDIAKTIVIFYSYSTRLFIIVFVAWAFTLSNRNVDKTLGKVGLAKCVHIETEKHRGYILIMSKLMKLWRIFMKKSDFKEGSITRMLHSNRISMMARVDLHDLIESVLLCGCGTQKQREMLQMVAESAPGKAVEVMVPVKNKDMLIVIQRPCGCGEDEGTGNVLIPCDQHRRL